MNRKVILSSVVWALSVGGIVAILNGDQRAVSLRIWLAAFAVWFAFATMQRLLVEVPMVTPRLRPLISLRRRRTVQRDDRPRELRGLESLIVRSRDNERAFTQQLQPRLAEVADHYLAMTHGIDRTREPERAAAVLGQLGWLLDDVSPARTPTMSEIDALLDVLIDGSVVTSPCLSGADEDQRTQTQHRMRSRDF